ncbi:MAG TPA: hypothetical protein VHN82_06930, partial [Methanoregula sp.]|nr:hypothetical protein [Methanoregula sp.]
MNQDKKNARNDQGICGKNEKRSVVGVPAPRKNSLITPEWEKQKKSGDFPCHARSRTGRIRALFQSRL